MRCLQPLLPCPSHHDELDLELGAKASLPLLRLFLSECSVTVPEKGSEGFLILLLSLGTQSIIAGKSRRQESETVCPVNAGTRLGFPFSFSLGLWPKEWCYPIKVDLPSSPHLI